jgi:hypothetical protein
MTVKNLGYHYCTEGIALKLYPDSPDFVDSPDGLPGFIKDATDLNAQNQMLCSIGLLLCQLKLMTSLLFHCFMVALT